MPPKKKTKVTSASKEKSRPKIRDRTPVEYLETYNCLHYEHPDRIPVADWKCPECGSAVNTKEMALDGGSRMCIGKKCSCHFHWCAFKGGYETEESPFHHLEAPPTLKKREITIRNAPASPIFESVGDDYPDSDHLAEMAFSKKSDSKKKVRAKKSAPVSDKPDPSANIWCVIAQNVNTTRLLETALTEDDAVKRANEFMCSDEWEESGKLSWKCRGHYIHIVKTAISSTVEQSRTYQLAADNPPTRTPRKKAKVEVGE